MSATIASKKNPIIKGGKSTLLFHIIFYPVISLFALACLLPFYLIIVASFTAEQTIIQEGFSFLFRGISTEGYNIILKNPTSILQAYGVTIFATLTGTVIALLMCTMTGYVLSRKDFAWRNKFAFFFFFTTLFSGGLVPTYLWNTKTLNFNNQIYALIVPLLFSVWNMIIAKSFMGNIPFEIVESAKIDGAGDFLIYRKLVLPLSLPLIATLGLFISLSYWNDWYNCMLYISDENLFTLQYYLQNMLNSAEALKRVAEKSGMGIKVLPMESMKMAMTVIATGPIILVYPFVQKYFVKGLTIGAVKG